MPLFYCFNCGFGTSYTLNKPKVCLKCNQNFYQPVSTASIPQVTQVNTTTSPPAQPLQEPLKISFSRDDSVSGTPNVNLRSFANVDKQRETKSFVFAPGSLDPTVAAPKPKRGRPSKK